MIGSLVRRFENGGGERHSLLRLGGSATSSAEGTCE